MKKNKKGFTLIELLVVIAIIGILATIVLVSLNTARQKARDARRISDLRQVQLALQMYYDSNSAYPSALVDLVTSGFMSAAPVDPSMWLMVMTLTVAAIIITLWASAWKLTALLWTAI